MTRLLETMLQAFRLVDFHSTCFLAPSVELMFSTTGGIFFLHCFSASQVEENHRLSQSCTILFFEPTFIYTRKPERDENERKQEILPKSQQQ